MVETYWYSRDVGGLKQGDSHGKEQFVTHADYKALEAKWELLVERDRHSRMRRWWSSQEWLCTERRGRRPVTTDAAYSAMRPDRSHLRTRYLRPSAARQAGRRGGLHIRVADCPR